MLRAALLATAVLALAGCGDEDPEPPSGPLSLAEALEVGDEPVEVRGFLYVDADTIRLCSMLAESNPPQCGEPALTVGGLAPHELPELERADEVAWSREQVTLLGTVDERTLRVVESR